MRFVGSLGAVGAVGLCSLACRAELVYGIRGVSTLALFDSASPGAQQIVGQFTGVTENHLIRAIDFRPTDGVLYGLSTESTTDTAQVYTIDLGNARATPMGAPFVLPANPNTSSMSIDFDPATDHLRIVSLDGANTRWSPTTGSLVQHDTSMAFAPGDPNAGFSPPNIVGIAYDFPAPRGVVGATLYGYELLSGALVRIGSPGGSPESPATGLMHTIGPSGVEFNAASSGLDISALTGVAYFHGTIAGGTDDDYFYTVDLASGAMTFVASMGSPMLDIAVPVPGPGSAAVIAAGLLIGAARGRGRWKRYGAEARSGGRGYPLVHFPGESDA